MPSATASYSPPEGHRDGVTYDAAEDYVRISGQARAVWHVMRDGRWRTLRQIAEAVGCQETSASARLRDFRKDRFGSHTVHRARREGGLHEYRVVRNRAVRLKV